jgi:hypothetical protein
MMKIAAQDKDAEFEEMIKWYNSQVFDWFSPNNKARGDDSSSSGIDEVMNRMEDLDFYDSEAEPQDDGEDRNEPIRRAETQVFCYHFFLSLI